MPLPFSLLRRRASTGKVIYYYRVALPDGSRSTARSTGQTSKAAATRWVLDQLDRNGATGRDRIRFESWAKDVWSPDSRYVRIRRAHGHHLGEAHVYTMSRITTTYLIPAFGKRYLEDISPDMVEQFLLDAFENGAKDASGVRRKLAARTVNMVRQALSAIMAEAVRLGHIRHNPVAATHKFREKPKERGVLSRAELWSLLFAPDALVRVWLNDRVAYLFVLVAGATGMRRGEVRALSPDCVREGFIEVRYGWDEIAGRRTDAPKWGHRRIATIPTILSDTLKEWAREKDIADDGFLFPGPSRGTVSMPHVTEAFQGALARIGIDAATRVRRNIVFHSLRHSFVTELRAAKIDGWQAMSVVGHRTERIFNGYSHAGADHLGDVADFQHRLISERPAEVQV